jgi:hypothetical protein
MTNLQKGDLMIDDDFFSKVKPTYNLNVLHGCIYKYREKNIKLE